MKRFSNQSRKKIGQKHPMRRRIGTSFIMTTFWATRSQRAAALAKESLQNVEAGLLKLLSMPLSLKTGPWSIMSFPAICVQSLASGFIKRYSTWVKCIKKRVMKMKR